MEDTLLQTAWHVKLENYDKCIDSIIFSNVLQR